jgi:K319-like protein
MHCLTSRRRVAFAFALTCALLRPAPGNASSFKDQAFEPSPPDTIPTISSSRPWAQTFTVGRTGTLTSVDVLFAQLFRTQALGLEITIFDTAGGAPHAAITPPFRFPSASVPIVIHPGDFGAYAYLSARFSLPVTAGDVLAIVASVAPTSGSDFQHAEYYWAGSFAGGYPGGALYSITGGPWFQAGAEDQAFRTFIAPSRAPAASAGDNQTVRQGTTVHLDGSGSYDDNTQTNLLQFAWTMVSVPTGSAVTTLVGADSMTPSFLPDVTGNYVVQLLVTDQDGLMSAPSLVTIGENPAPTANAGPDQVAIVNHIVALDGSAADPDGDAITYSWRFTAVPGGSHAQLAEPNAAATTFIPDLPGVYVATLTPSDSFGPGASASATVTVTTGTMYAELQSQAVAARVQDLAADVVTSAGNQNAMVQFLGNTINALQRGNVAGARHQLQQAMSRTDGCALQGTPDGNGPGRDWITTCTAQDRIYPSLVAALLAITP